MKSPPAIHSPSPTVCYGRTCWKRDICALYYVHRPNYAPHPSKWIATCGSGTTKPMFVPIQLAKVTKPSDGASHV